MFSRRYLWMASCALLLGACATAKNSSENYVGPGGPSTASTTSTTSTIPSEPATSASLAALTADEAVASAALATTGTLQLSVLESIVLALENNRAFRVERFNPAIQRTLVDEERARFDPTLTAQGSQTRVRSQRLARAGAGIESQVTETTNAEGHVTAFLPTGTTLDLFASGQRVESSLYANTFTSLRGGLTVTQALLRGFGIGVNLADLRQTRLAAQASRYELRALAETLVAQVEQAYWDYALAQQQIGIFEESLRLAARQLAETRERISVGAIPEVELAAGEAEFALRREGLINARSALATARILILRLMNPPSEQPLEMEVDLRNEPIIPDVQLGDVEEHIELAKRMRAEINQAKLAIQSNELEIIQTRNGLLPRMDFFMTLAKTGYADSLRPAFNMWDEPGTYDTQYGLSLEYPLFNRRARALNRRAVLSRDQAEESLANLEQLVEVDVRTAYIEVQRAREQVAATAATRYFQEEAVRVETEKFRVGRSTNLLVARAQRDLVQSRIAEVQAVVNNLRALINLYRLDGSLLLRRGIAAPGREPVEKVEFKWWK